MKKKACYCNMKVSNLFHGLAPIEHGLEGGIRCLGNSHHFQQLHHWHGVEEMEATKPKYNPSINHFQQFHNWHGVEEMEATKPKYQYNPSNQSTTSSSFITGTGLNKCRPPNLNPVLRSRNYLFSASAPFWLHLCP